MLEIVWPILTIETRYYVTLHLYLALWFSILTPVRGDYSRFVLRLRKSETEIVLTWKRSKP